MKVLHKVSVVLAVGIGLTAPAIPIIAAPESGWYGRDVDYGNIRGIVDRTQTDLQTAANLEQGSKERDRYHNAQSHLSNLDKELAKGRFDKGKLESAIKELQNVLNHNTLQASMRDALMRDVTDLKIARDRR
jgi:predicted negative regulator of RcsB-dependent stress response